MRYKDDNKNDQIFHAAIELINEIGFAETSMSKIAKNANVSPSTIYVYFENKNDMIKKLYLTIKIKMSEKMFEGINETTSVKDGFQRVFKNFIDFALNNKEYFLFKEQFANSPLVENLCGKESNELFKPMVDIFERGKRENLFKQVDTKLLIIYSFSPIIQFAKDYFKGEFQLNDEKIEQMIQMSWDGIYNRE